MLPSDDYFIMRGCIHVNTIKYNNLPECYEVINETFQK